MKRSTLFAGGAVLLAGGVLFLPFQEGAAAGRDPLDGSRIQTMDLSSFPQTPPSRPHSVLFIHHSVGGHLLAEPGPKQNNGGPSLYVTHPNGGGLRRRLEEQGYMVHEASYGSDVGNATDTLDWLPKFRDNMDKVLRVDKNDVFLGDGKRQDIVIFKSCYTDTAFVGEGTPPGNPQGPERTLWNFKAHLSALLPVLQKHPDVLFVYVTMPPTSAIPSKQRLWKVVARTALGKPSAAEVLARRAAVARKFNAWVAASDGWLRDYPLKNVVTFDYYDILTDHGASTMSRYVPHDGDSHPTSEGNAKATAAFVPFLNRAVNRAGL